MKVWNNADHSQPQQHLQQNGQKNSNTNNNGWEKQEGDGEWATEKKKVGDGHKELEKNRDA